MSLFRSGSGRTEVSPDDVPDRNIPRHPVVETTGRRLTVDLVVNVRFRTAPLLLAAPVVCLTAADLLASAVALLGLVPDLSGSHLRLSTSARV